jgi:hypothetical protein
VGSRRENLYFDYLLEHIVEIWPQKKIVRSGQLGPKCFTKILCMCQNHIFQVEKKWKKITQNFPKTAKNFAQNEIET